MHQSIIEGTGGAETQEAIGMITLRLVAKNPGEATWENFLRNQR